jgi:hypothetical protein
MDKKSDHQQTCFLVMMSQSREFLISFGRAIPVDKAEALLPHSKISRSEIMANNQIDHLKKRLNLHDQSQTDSPSFPLGL